MHRPRLDWLLFALLGLAGCNQSPFLAAQPAPPYQTLQQPAGLAQAETLNRRATSLDADNKDLYGELARSQQHVQLLQDELKLLRTQLKDRASELDGLQVAKSDLEDEIQSIRKSTQRRGGAIITANNSMRESLPVVEIQGLEVRRDGDTVRIEIPADQLFQQGTSGMLSTAQPIIDRVAAAIRQGYADRQIVIEGHTDNVPQGGTSNHRLSAEQSAAVFDALTRRNQIPIQQLRTASFGANRPQVSNATPGGRAKNRRIEVVVMPDSYQDR